MIVAESFAPAEYRLRRLYRPLLVTPMRVLAFCRGWLNFGENCVISLDVSTFEYVAMNCPAKLGRSNPSWGPREL